MALNPSVFAKQFSIFKGRVAEKSGRPFVSFREGLALEWEGYKEPLRQVALTRLKALTWQQGSIGKGDILKCLISAIEIQKDSKEEGNNLVRWRDEYGHRNRAHYLLLDAQTQPELRQQIESWAFDFYRGDVDPGDAFESLRSIVGSRYDLLAYLFFLKDSQLYMPIASTTFDKAFEALELDIKTAWKCSWSNYREYLGALTEIRYALRTMPGLGDSRLLDAHSFCWLLVRPEMERPDKLFAASAKGKATNTKLYDAFETSIYDMVEMTVETVRSANGQLVSMTRKVKELWMSNVGLSEYVRQLLKKQEGKCALTGIELKYQGENEDRPLRPSLDRIDSDRQYEDGNLQIVCRFINRWKSNTPDEEFRRLLSLVRGGD